MDTAAHFDAARVEVTPGVEASCRLTVANNGTIVEGYTFEPVGELAQFTTVEPATLSLYPGTEGGVTVRVNAPREPRIRAGEVPFAVVIRPREQPDDRLVPEGLLLVQGFTDTGAELTPRTSQARLWTKHALAVDNRGNRPIEATVTGADPDDHLRIRCRPETVEVGSGEAAFTKVRVRPRKTMWRGQHTTRPFQLLVTSDDAPAVPVDGQVVQEPIFPRGTGKLLAVALAGVVALAVLWFAVLRPTIRSAAQEAVREPIAAARQEAAEANMQAQQASRQAEQAGGTATRANQAARRAAAAAPTETDPFGRRLSVSAPAGERDEATFVVPENRVVTVTDLVFESPGDTGTVRLRRGDDELITVRTQDFRTLDQHFVSPIVFSEGEEVIVRLACRQPVNGRDQCREAVYIGGTIQREPRASPSPSPSP